MKRSFALLICIGLFGFLKSQPVTFFTHNLNNFGGEKIFSAFSHEFPEGGYVQGYDVDYKTHHEMAWEYFDKTGQFTGKIQPQIRYWDVRVDNSKALSDRKLFVYGNDVNAAKRGLFSMCFDSSGTILWEHNDSVVVQELFEESDTNYFGILTVQKSTNQFKEGYHLARLNRSGIIYWSKPFDDLLQQVSTDSGTATPIIGEFEYFGDKFIFHLIGSTSFEHNWVVVFDRNFKLQTEQYAKYINRIFPHERGLIFDYDIGKPSPFSRYAIKNIDWVGKELWVIKANDSAVSSLSGLGFFSVGSGFCNYHIYQDSMYNLVDRYLGFYNFSGKKFRECKYYYKDNFSIAIRSTTNDEGLLMNAGPKSWDRLRIGVLKTDSLGLVYNTDVICDCIDFKVGQEELTVPKLTVQIFPNPANNKINVLLSHQQKATINLLNLNGQVVKSQVAEFNTNIMDISELDKGLYFVEVMSVGGKTVKKLAIE